jgi:MgtE intracellular N domain
MPRRAKPKPEIVEKRPDPAFKQVLTEEARKLGLKRGPTELQIAQTTSSDMLLLVPSGTRVKDTLFEFFRAVNIVEFKSANDPLTLQTLEIQLARLYLLLAENSDYQFEQTLNIIVSARYPREVFGYSESKGYPFKGEGKDPTDEESEDWLYRANLGYQDVVVVVCEQLPLKPLYLDWLIFAAADSETWREAVLLAVKEHKLEILKLAREMHPKEYEAMGSNIKMLFEQYSPQERERLKRDWFDVLEDILPQMGREEPKDLGSLLSKVDPENLGQALDNLEAKNLGQALDNLEAKNLGQALSNLNITNLAQALEQLSEEQRSKLLKSLMEKSQN